MKPTVQLITHTNYPLETIYLLWEASRHNQQIMTAQAVAEKRKEDPAFDAKIRKLFTDVLNSGIPVAENISFTFLLENVSIALREQMVRHRIGVRVGDRVGCDHVPDLADSTWWSQSMRILDMGSFASDGAYDVPDTIQGNQATAHYTLGPVNVEDAYRGAMHNAGQVYKELVAAGVPAEDARNVIPLGATHRISWTLNLAALKHIIGKRGCWILQLGVWEPVIRGMVDRLAEWVDPIFRDLIAPPCIKGDKFAGCCFKLDNERRIDGEDSIPPCSLYLNHHADEALQTVRRGDTDGERTVWQPWADGPGFRTDDLAKQARYVRMKGEYRALWGRDPDTGDKLPG